MKAVISLWLQQQFLLVNVGHKAEFSGEGVTLKNPQVISTSGIDVAGDQ